MNQNDIDALTAVGLKPIIIDENFDFNTLNDAPVLVIDLSPYDAVEVSPCTKDKHGDCEVCEPNDPNIAMWSIYLHMKEGGVECIADCPTEETASLIAEALERTFPSLQAYGRKTWCKVDTE